MPKNKTCPFKLFLSSINEKSCNKSGCQLWSTETSMCSFTVGMLAILNAAESIREISDNIKSLDSFQS
jgi:hypothetical protein